MSLWLTPNNLYVVGFQNQNGLSWDPTTMLLDLTDYGEHPARRGTGPGNGSYLARRQQYQGQLPFGGNYISLSHAAQRGRDAMPSSFQQLINSVNNLATTPNAPADSLNVARPLTFRIQFTSEAARFVPLQNFVRDNVLRDLSVTAPAAQALLRSRSWKLVDRISDFAYRVTQNPRTAALVIPSVGFLRSFRDVQLLMAKTARRRSALRVGPRPMAPQTCSPSGPSAHARRSRGTLVWT
jgi:hypothetical protein